MKKYTAWINQTFGRRIAAFFIPAIVILIIVTGTVCSYIYYSVFRTLGQQNIEGIIRRGNSTADLYFQDIKTTAVLLSENDDLIYMLTDYENMSVQEKFYQQEKVDEALRNTSLMRDYILDCIIVGLNGYQTNMPDRQDLKSGTDLLSEDWIRPFTESGEGGFWYTGAHHADYYSRGSEIDNVLSVVFPIRPYGERLGYIIVDLDFNRINDIIVEERDVNGLRFLVADEEGNIVFSDDSEEINTKLPETAVEKFGTGKSFFFRYQGQEIFCKCENSTTTKWEFVGMVPRATIMKPVSQMIKVLAFIILPIFALVAVILSIRISGRVKKPLNEIVRQLESLDINDPKPVLVRNSVGEIDYLALKITEMSERITRLINQVYVSEIKSKDAQIEALISQINPHFLYNTLQLIKLEAVRGEKDEASSTVNCLSRFLRYTINNRKLYVTLSEELDYIRNYIEIYQKRFPGKYILDIQADESEMEIMIPKLTLQPIVENAIKYGLRQKDGTGTIHIFAEGDKDLEVKIEDNGLGMDPKEIPDLMQRIQSGSDEGGHVGLRNIQERLELAGGSEYGITKIESEKGKFFRVYLRIKKGWDHV